MAVNETMHHRTRSKFRLPPPIQHKGHSHIGSQGSSNNVVAPRSSLPLPPPRRIRAKDSDVSSGSSHSDAVGSAVDSDNSNMIATNVPGRPRRRPQPKPTTIANEKCMHASAQMNHHVLSTKEHAQSPQHYNLPVPAAVLLWYLLGVVSIASSKVLLSTHGVPPLLLTVQQLVIGMTLLRFLLLLGKMNSSEDPVGGRLQHVPMQRYSLVIEGSHPSIHGEICEIKQPMKRKSSNISYNEMGIASAVLAIIPAKLQRCIKGNDVNQSPHIDIQLLAAAVHFTLGFLFTNYGFQSGSAAFVETIKAAEPITSASVAVAWGIERLGQQEVISLAGIVAGVILSTMAQHETKAVPGNHHTQSSVMKFFIVMVANLCFSFRGLHQKLFRATPQGKVSSVDDLNLQFRMQQIGVLMLIGPALLGNAFWLLRRPSLFDMHTILRYIPLTFVNGIAFTSYNLASTYVLTRVSVVHHAALNCIRRVFAIVVTSIVFGLKITALQVVGIATSVGGFFAFSHYKLKRGIKEKRRKELRRKYGVETTKMKGTPKWENGANDSKGWVAEKKEADCAV